MESGLYLVGTPLGNLRDITLRALDALRECDVLYAEDTRHTRKLLTHYEISRRLRSCHKFNEASRVQEVLGLIREGRSVGLVSSAGMPGISDPGARLVRACREADLCVTVVPGPAAVTSFAALSGFVERGFVFEGFPPPKSGARHRLLESLGERKSPTIFYESPHRIERFLGEVATLLPGHTVCVGRELTKAHEEVVVGDASSVARWISERKPRGEFTLLIAPPPKRRSSEPCDLP